MNEFAAAMGICNLRRLNESISSRRQVHERYNSHLDNVPGIRICKPQKDVDYNYAYYAVFFDKKEFGLNRDEVFTKLRQNDIYARKYFYPATNEVSCYKGKYNETPIAHNASLNILTLPIYEGLALEDVDRICKIILSK